MKSKYLTNMKAKSFPKKLLFLAITFLIFFIVIELVFRSIFFSQHTKFHTSVFIQGNTLQMSDSLLVYRNRPYYLDYNNAYQNNEEGFKSFAGDTEMPIKSSNDFWVFLFGASAMEGMGSNKDGEWLDITGINDRPYKETIAYYLKNELQKQMPEKHVEVFCAANSGYTAYQSMLQYERLKNKYKIDFAISLDGVNEPLIIDTIHSERELIENDWKQYPIFKAPLKYIIPLTSRLAFLNQIKQFLFHGKLYARLQRARKNNFPAQQKWMHANEPKILFNNNSLIAKRTTDTLFYYLKLFDKELTENHVPHILFLQPHLALRDTLLLSSTEKALHNYYCSLSKNNGDYNQFLREMHLKAKQETIGNIQSLDFMDSNKQETFVDYCHFTTSANVQLSKLFADSIISRTSSSQKQQ